MFHLFIGLFLVILNKSNNNKNNNKILIKDLIKKTFNVFPEIHLKLTLNNNTWIGNNKEKKKLIDILKKRKIEDGMS
jgi:hypothetical protein